jgi:peroxin-19
VDIQASARQDPSDNDFQYPDYLASPPKDLPAADLTKYKNQYALVQKIVDTFRKPGYSDDRDGKEIARLVGEMQDLGGPPQEIMGDLPEGFVSLFFCSDSERGSELIR